MGSKPSHAQPSNRPESGGADHDDQRESSGQLDREKAGFAEADAAKREAGNSENTEDRGPGKENGEHH
jgi:hypothetical protein